MNRINKFDVNVSLILNGLEKYKAFTRNKNLVFDSKQFMNCSIQKLVKNVSDNDFKFLSEEFNLNSKN